jgi:hypothetical protein
MVNPSGLSFVISYVPGPGTSDGELKSVFEVFEKTGADEWGWVS